MELCYVVRNRMRVLHTPSGHSEPVELPIFRNALLSAREAAPDALVRVVDFGSTDVPDFEAAVKEVCPGAVVERMDGEFCKGRALNHLLDTATCDVVFFVDADMILDANTVRQAADHCALGRAFFPICSTEEGHYDRRRQLWLNVGYGNVAVPREGATERWDGDRKKWGGEDVWFHDLVRKRMHVVRQRQLGLKHQWHPRSLWGWDPQSGPHTGN